MLSRRLFLHFASLGGLAAGFAAGSAPAAPPGKWSASGTLLESCTCAVPCTCNFGEGPSPHSYCHAVYGYKLDKAVWDGVDLSGLIVGGADGPNGSSAFVDARAAGPQKPALEKLARALFAQGGPSGAAQAFVPVAITHQVAGNALRLDFAGRGGFAASVIVGRDGKSPVVVENNTVWPIARAIKAKSRPLAFSDKTAGAIKGDGTNANYGAFTFSGQTGASATKPAAPAVRYAKTGSGCCAGKK